MILNTFPLLHCFFNTKRDGTANQIRTCSSIKWGTTCNHYFIHTRKQFLDFHMILNTFPLLHRFFNTKRGNTANQIRTCFSIEWGTTSNHYFIHTRKQFLDFHMILNTFPLLHCFFNSKQGSTANQDRRCFSIEWGTISNHYLLHIKSQFLDFHMILNGSPLLHCFCNSK